MNVIQVAGRLGSDPEVRFTSTGQKVTSFRMATNSRRGGKDETIWWRVTVWGERFDKMMTYLKKGSAVIVVGEMHKPDIYTNREGQPQASLEITAEMIKFSPFGRSGSENTDGAGVQQQGVQQPQQTQQSGSYSFETGVQEPVATNSIPMGGDDNIPF